MSRAIELLREPNWAALAAFALDWIVRAGLAVRVILRRRPVGISLAWLTIILSAPYVGAVIYLLIGELRLGNRRAERAAAIHGPYRHWLEQLRERGTVDSHQQGPSERALARQVEATVGIPALDGNALERLDDAEATFRALIADIDRARRTCHLEFYIWGVGGRADDVAEALCRAARRGIACRVLVDAVGSREFLRSDVARRLRAAGVQVTAALPVGLFRALFVRFDLRMHRKIVVIDGEIAYTGSLNLADPRLFKQDAHVGQWVDAAVRLRGPAVEALAITFLEDWELETGEGVDILRQKGDAHPNPSAGPSVVQVIPSGPAVRADAMQAILLTTIYAARRELVMTTPYFVPDESMLTALVAAAQRGVEVTVVVPRRVDSRLVRLASRSHSGDLLEVGVRVLQFRGGLLHTKSVTVDGEWSLFGSLNLDPRSLHLNFEITLAIYDDDFTAGLRQLQQSYIDQSVPMNLEAWRRRPLRRQLAEDAARLLSPLL